jgi:hypothetical protein
MSAYGKVISGGAKMSKGLSKGINDKLASFEAGHSHAKTIATAVGNAFKVKHLSDQTTNNVNGGKFEKVKPQKNV